MTSTPQVTDGVDADDEAPAPAPVARAHRRYETLAAVAGGLAVLCAVLMPLLPVSASTPTVSWPREAGRPGSTAVQLVTQRPLGLSAVFDCATARRAAATPDGLVLATMPREAPDLGRLALTASVRGDVLTVRTRGTTLVEGPLPPGPCTVEIAGDLGGVRALVDGRTVGTAPGRDLPDVDALVTSVSAPPGAPPAALAVRLQVDDQAATTPTAVKTAVGVLLAVAVLVAIAALVAGDRSRPPRRPDRPDRGGRAAGGRGPTARWRRLRYPPAVVDVVVPLVMTAWLFLAPMTDDDGYYSAMAANVPSDGYVANFFQLYNQSFTPFTWIYYALSWWQSVAGFSPVVLRLPALLLGFATWLAVRLFIGRSSAGDDPTRLVRVRVRVVLAVCFLAWWLPYDMGVRPEAVVAATTAASMLLLAVALERGRRAPAAVAVGVAAFGVTAAPTGFVALAPLLVAAPGVWRLVSSGSTRARALAALVPVIAPGALIGLLSFADGSLRDFTRAQQIFLGMQSTETWYTEIVRWNYLLSDIPMGNDAKRAPVLLGLLALAVALVLIAGARRGAWDVPPRLPLAAWTTLVGFALLWLTPSKWTHHFGTLAGVGSVVLTLALLAAPRAAGARVGRPRWSVVVGAAAALAALAALAGHGPNSWPYSWLLGLPDPDSPPQVSVLRLDQPLWYLLAAGVVTAGILVVRRRRGAGSSATAGVAAVAIVACLSLVATTTYLVGGFALGVVNTASTWSPWADAVRDPLARDCLAASQVEALDPGSASPLAVALPAPPPVGPTPFVPGGWFPASPPPAGLAARVPVVGSFAETGGSGGPDAAVGRLTTPWYTIPAGRGDEAISTAVAGRVGEGNSLVVEYARRGPDGAAQVVGERELGLPDDDGARAAVDSVSWRSIVLDRRDAPVPGSTLLRLVAVDSSTAPGGWLALAAPSRQRWRPLPSFLPPGGPVAVGWQFSFLFPCQRQPRQADGLNEPAPFALAWGDQPLSGLQDGIFQPERGGHFAQSLRDGPTAQLAVRLRDFPEVDSIQLYSFGTSLPSDGYEVVPGRRTVSGFTPAPNTTFSTPVDDVTVRPGT